MSAVFIIALLISWLTPVYAPAPPAMRSLEAIPIAVREIVGDFAPARATVVFGGDMMFDRTVRTAIEGRGGDFIFSCIEGTLRGADLVVANLEGPITPNASMSVGSVVGSLENMTFTFPTSTAALLARHNIGLVNLGNNHIMNFGEEGARTTMVALAEAGVGFFGSPLQSAFVRRIVAGVPMEFVSYNEFGGSGAEVARHQIEYARRDGYLPIVYAHWGDEYATTSATRERSLAHSFVDAGAEIVIGSHPHVVQEHEMYDGKHIYYSLGNFVFDQYFSEDVRNGLLLNVTFTKERVAAIKEIPISLERDRRTCLRKK